MNEPIENYSRALPMDVRSRPPQSTRAASRLRALAFHSAGDRTCGLRSPRGAGAPGRSRCPLPRGPGRPAGGTALACSPRYARSVAVDRGPRSTRYLGPRLREGGCEAPTAAARSRAAGVESRPRGWME